jgi:hypothetical protein
MEGIWIALIGAGASIVVGVLTFLGVVFTNKKSNEKFLQQMKEEIAVYKAVTNEKITELTREVRKHNNFAERMPVVENEIAHIEGDIKQLRKYHERG